MRIWRGFRHLPVRHKLIALALLPLAVVLPQLAVVLWVWGDVAFDRLLVTKVRSDLAVAKGYFDRVRAEVDASTLSVAEAHSLHLALARLQSAELVARLEAMRRRERLDFLNLRNADGSLLLTHGGAAVTSATPPAAASERGSVEVLSLEQLAALAPDLAARVPVPLLPTRSAMPTTREREDRAMVMLATRPVRDEAGRVIAHVQGGILLNRNLALIDHINDIVYPDGALPFGSRGTATLFLDDVRISTNVRLFGGADAERAIGTRVSQAVRERVLGSGHTWLGRAFVVDDWYVSGYEPIEDGDGRRVGMLYVGFTEQPFTWVKVSALGGVAALFALVMVLAAVISLRWARTIFAPVERMSETMQRVEAGDLAARAGDVGSSDEMGELAGHLDHLLDTVAAHTERLRAWNAELDAKVAERTRELREAQAHLVRSEKLAAVGQLTAGIAHEVNNPIAVLQGHLDLMRELLGDDAQRIAAELAIADEQVERVRLIVTKLLQFARPSEYALDVEPVDVAAVLEDCVVLARHPLARSGIQLHRDFRATRTPMFNRRELQQVFVNLIVNAIQAMPGGGTLTLATRDAGNDAVEVTVADTGPGIDDDLAPVLFQPFVTRKREGTGLGLWVSRGLVERHGGDLRAGRRPDGAPGAVFTVTLRVDGKATDATSPTAPG